MPNRKKYSNLSKRQVFRRLAAQSKADIHVLHNSSLQLANELQSEDDIFYIRQRLCEEKYNFQPKINIESGGIHDIVENEIDIENIEMNDEDNIIHQGYYMVAPLRTDDTFRSRMNEEHHIAVSPFESLLIDMEFKKLYGEQYVTSNFHYLIHLNEDVKMYGPLDSYSSFDFENHMQILKRMLRKHANPLQQIHRRLSEKHNRDQHLQKKKNPNILNPLLKYPIVSELPLGCHSEHKILQFRTFELSNKRPDNCCFMTDATIVIIKHIGLIENMQYYVVFFDDFCNLVPANWINVESNDILWLPKNLKFNKHKMHYLQPDDDWLTYKCRKRLGPFESLQIANQIEEHCINASTNEDTDDVCEKALFLSQTEQKRRRKKPAYLDDTSEEEQECGSSCVSTEVFENNKALEKSFVQDKSFDSTLVLESTGGTIATLQKQTSTHLGKKACVEKIRDINRTTENLFRFSKQRRIEATTSANADLETDIVMSLHGSIER
ncbi:hypothetical protein RF55_13785, partial [Lasius niger]